MRHCLHCIQLNSSMSSSSIYSCIDAQIERVIEFQLQLNDKTKLRMLLAVVRRARARESLNEKCFWLNM